MKEEKTINDTISIGVLVVGTVYCGLTVLGGPITAVCFVGGFTLGYARHWWSS